MGFCNFSSQHDKLPFKLSCLEISKLQLKPQTVPVI